MWFAFCVLAKANTGKLERIKMQNEYVLLHGWGMNQGVWQMVHADIADVTQATVRCLDLPGFGLSPKCPDPYSLAKSAELLATQLKNNSILVGWSLGGLFALYLAKHFPEKVEKIILVSSGPFFSQRTDWPGINPDVLQAFKQQLAEHGDKTIDRFLAIQAMGSDSAKQDVRNLKKLLKDYPLAQKKALSGGLDILLNEDLRPAWRDLKQPISGIFGARDTLVPLKAVTNMQKLNPHFKAVIIDKASHAPFISHKAEFLKVFKSMC